MCSFLGITWPELTIFEDIYIWAVCSLQRKSHAMKLNSVKNKIPQLYQQKWLTIIILKQWFKSQIICISISYDDFLRMNWYIQFVIVSIHSFSLISASVYFNSAIVFKNFSRKYVFKMRSILICIIQFFILILNLFVICWLPFSANFF